MPLAGGEKACPTSQELALHPLLLELAGEVLGPHARRFALAVASDIKVSPHPPWSFRKPPAPPQPRTAVARIEEQEENAGEGAAATNRCRAGDSTLQHVEGVARAEGRAQRAETR